MRVLGIDPGTSIVGFGCIELPERSVRRGTGRVRNEVSLRFGSGGYALVEAGVLPIGRPKAPIAERLLRLGRALDELLGRLQPAALAVEEAFYGKSVQSALRIGEARGVVLLCAARARAEIAQYPPATIKLRVAGSGGASKEALARMVGATLRDPVEALPRDATDALAVALCHCLSLASIPGG